ncbi:uncharacterized protein LOC133495495 [Syngnathoides biaculeatus]|uniref:uncharacterized protein LOC133495495 n=1 Tax=Syngnathoides biaculeatus TaxID=300417 RepID=UPI002ADE17E8|nr:uncharacterized protein LOC133495495 [Syngnathoides biaculeatus]
MKFFCLLHQNKRSSQKRFLCDTFYQTDTMQKFTGNNSTQKNCFVMILPLQPGLCGCPRGCADREAHTCASCGLIILCIYMTPTTTGPCQFVELHVPFEYSRIPDRQLVCTDLRLFSDQPLLHLGPTPVTMGRDRTNWPKQDPAGKTRRRRDRRKVDRLLGDQACRVGSLTSSASVSYAPPARYEYIPNTTHPAPHILLDSDFSEYEEELDLYDRLPEYDSDDFDYESLYLVFHPSQFVSPHKYNNPYEGTRLAIYPGPPRGGQRRRPGLAVPCASRGAATKTPSSSSHSSPATVKPADPQLVAKLPPPREEEPPNHEVFCREMRVEIELVALKAQVRQGLANQPSYADVATATDLLLTLVHVAVGTDPLPRHVHMSVSTDSLPTLVRVTVETDPPPRQAHTAVGTDSPPCQVHVAVGTDSPPSQAHVAVETDPLCQSLNSVVPPTAIGRY